ncbi:hypothetical protein RND71_040765 [Anisodus tanguticus]|uniref:RIC1 C-terminal alpha solenoid region domain-containing protein n=1 Tax=Anisodus tanguticus TaxID=243964 RepID=A0AAE1QUM2_9SOLA|nr:hypothetical protein RND71_040765 [Anisodus tanguticus]
MYMAYGWPQVIPMESGIVYLKLINRLLLVVTPTHIELWSSSQHRVRLSKYKRSSGSIHKEGENLRAVWSPDTKLIALLTSSFYLHILKVQFTERKIQIGGKQPTGLFLASISLLLNEQVPFANKNLTISHSSKNSAVIHLEFSLPLRLLVVLFSDGQLVLCSVSKKGLKQMEFIKAEKRLGSGDAVCAAVASVQQLLAVGTRRGVVELYDIAESASFMRSVSLYDWGYSVEDIGAVSCVAWTPDNSAFAVGWKLRGLTVWSVSGCRFMSTIRQIGLSSTSSPVVKRNQECKYEPMMSGTSLMNWDEYGYRLYAIEEGSSERIVAFSFGKCCLNRGVSGTTYVRQVSYISQNWPVQHVAASKDGMYLAAAGLHGLILYDIRLKKWRVFGDVTQEQKIQCRGLLWLGKIVVVCNYDDSSDGYELLFYPRYHLDQSSLLCLKPLLTKPMVMDVYQDYLLVTYRPFDVHIYHVKLSGELTPSSSPDLQLSTVRELSIMTAKSHPASMRFIPDQLPRESIAGNGGLSTSLDLSVREPIRCLILRTNGELSLLDLDEGRERELTDSVELFWVTCGQSEEKTSLIGEVSWLDYGHRGMQVWYPSPGADAFKQEDFLQLDPELEFDREVYPLGLLPNAGVVVGVSQRMSFSACTEFPCFEPSPQAQTILHCLLRHLLQRDKKEEALRLAQLSAEKPHFSHCLEWLLFTVFESDISGSKNQSVIPNHSTNSSLLDKTCDLIRNFLEYFDVVATLDESLYELAGELVRFLLRSGREYEPTTTDSEKLSPRLDIFCFLRSAHVASVKNILESHASYLMSGKELSKLVAFVKGTQFDLVEYLQRERYGSARLDNFASGLELIGEKLQMETLQSRLDAEFLLSHMCSVKFKEWIVVLATLLRRSEVLFDLFQHDLCLWKAYSITLKKKHELSGCKEPLNSFAGNDKHIIAISSLVSMVLFCFPDSYFVSNLSFFIEGVDDRNEKGHLLYERSDLLINR